MALRIICPVCRSRMTINLQSGLVYCKGCGYQPMHEWQNLPPTEARIQLHPLTLKGETKAKGEMIECPACGGDELEPVPGQAMLHCTTCGKKYPIKVHNTGKNSKAAAAEKSLRAVLMQRYGQIIQWEVTGRILDCSSCGGQSTLPPDALADHCPFCDSRYVIVNDAAATLEAPSSIIPFKIGAQSARKLVDERLNSGLLKNISRHLRDKIVRVSGNPLFLPFWIFEITTEVFWRYPEVFARSGTETSVHTTEPIYAALANHDVVPQLLPYDFTEKRDYAPEYLAGIPAQLNQIDMVQVVAPISKQAIREAKKAVLKKRPRVNKISVAGSDVPVRSQLKMEPYVSSVTYEFILLPVWVILLHEADGDVRRALVNGQTGEVYVDGVNLWGRPVAKE
jgi:Zn finger protein HypA/HybF involved in hydrogenase expression